MRRTLILALTALAIWSLGYGPLMPWSPVRPGFSSIAGRRLTIVYSEALAPPGPLRDPDALLREAEQFHGLSFTRHVTVFLCPDWSTAHRVLPRLARRGVGGITLATGHAIYILPTVAERGLDPVEFVRHELSHAVLHQNQSILDAVRIAEVQWLAEGIAVWFGRQRAYITDDEFLRLAPKRDLPSYLDPALRARLGESFDMRFAYVCWKHFNQFLQAKNSQRYWLYVYSTIAKPLEWRENFAHHFQRTFSDAIGEFERQTSSAN